MDQKLSQYQIQTNEQALQEAYAVANMGSWTYELQTNRIIWSDQVFKIYGLASHLSISIPDIMASWEAPTPEQLLLLYHPEDRIMYQRAVLEAVQHGSSFDLDLRIVTSHNQTRYINLVARPLFLHNKRVTHVHGTVMDISSRKESEISLQKQNLELQKINSQLDRFVYSAAHDLRAPLMSLLGLTELLDEQVTPKEKNFYLQLMKRSIHNLDSLISDIIQFSRNERTPVLSQLIDIKAMCEQLWAGLSYGKISEDKTGRDIDFQVEMKQYAPFYSDSKRINTILSNLLANAIHYCDKQKQTCLVHIKAEITAQHIQIQIRDNGIGIASEHLTSIFNMFYRASENSSGSGLGLFIVQQMISTLQGSIRVASTLHQETEFTLIIPNSLAIEI